METGVVLRGWIVEDVFAWGLESFVETSGDLAYSLGAYGLKGFKKFKSLSFI